METRAEPVAIPKQFQDRIACVWLARVLFEDNAYIDTSMFGTK